MRLALASSVGDGSSQDSLLYHPRRPPFVFPNADFMAALDAVRTTERTSVIYIQNDRYQSVPGYESWWDVPIAEVSTNPQVQDARSEWETMRAQERYSLG